MSGVKIPDYGMYTREGNRQVYHLVKAARAIGSSWPRTYKYLEELSKHNNGEFAEALDTVVREHVYKAIGAFDRGEAFYI